MGIHVTGYPDLGIIDRSTVFYANLKEELSRIYVIPHSYIVWVCIPEFFLALVVIFIGFMFTFGYLIPFSAYIYNLPRMHDSTLSGKKC